MSDLFGPTAIPKWMGSDEANLMYAAKGREDAAPFVNSFQSALDRSFKSKEADKQRDFQDQESEKERGYQQWNLDQTNKALSPLIDSMKEKGDSFDMPTWLKEHPEAALNPRTAPIVNNFMGNWAKAKAVELGATKAKDSADMAQKRIDQSSTMQKQNNAIQDAWSASSALTRAAIEKLPNQGKDPKTGFWSAEAELEINKERIAKGELSIGAKTKPGAETNEEKNIQLLKRLRDAGDQEGAKLVENILKARGHLGLPKDGPGSGKLTGEDATKEKDLTIRIRGIEKELDAAKAEKTTTPDTLMKIQEKLLDAQTKRHKLYQNLSPKTDTTTQKSSVPKSATPASKPATSKTTLTPDIAADFLKRAKGNRAQAEAMAAEAGYEW